MTAFLFIALFYLQYLLFPPFFLFSYVCPSKINIKDSSYFSNDFNMKILKYKSMTSYQYLESSAQSPVCKDNTEQSKTTNTSIDYRIYRIKTNKYL